MSRRFLLGAVLLLASLAGSAAPPSPAPGTARSTRQIAPGVTLVQEVTSAASPGGPLVVNVVRVDPRQPGVRVAAALGGDRVWGDDPTQGRETVSRLAARRKAIVAVNAGYFPFAGNPIGIHLEDGDLVTEPNQRTVLLIEKSGAASLARLRFAGTVTAPDGTTFAISGLNRRPARNDALVLFTHRFAPATLLGPDRFEVAVRGRVSPLAPNVEHTGRVTLAAPGGGHVLAPDTLVLSGSGAGAQWLREHTPSGARLRLRLQIDGAPERIRDWRTVRLAVAGGPRLLAEGRVAVNATEEGFDGGFANGRHPRTAAGIASDGALLLITVDGRQRGFSQGATLAELAALLLKHGARDAVNLDGGGSTTLVVRDALTNAPSDGRERPVANALLVFADAAGEKTGAKPPLALAAPSDAVAPLVPGRRRAFALRDAAGRVLSAHPRAVWGTAGGVGFVTQDGVFYALRPGRGTVQAVLGDVTASAPVTVEAAMAPAETLPPPVP